MNNLDQIKARINDLSDQHKTTMEAQVEFAYAIGVQDGRKQAMLERLKAMEAEREEEA